MAYSETPKHRKWFKSIQLNLIGIIISQLKLQFMNTEYVKSSKRQRVVVNEAPFELKTILNYTLKKKIFQ